MAQPATDPQPAGTKLGEPVSDIPMRATSVAGGEVRGVSCSTKRLCLAAERLAELCVEERAVIDGSKAGDSTLVHNVLPAAITTSGRTLA